MKSLRQVSLAVVNEEQDCFESLLKKIKNLNSEQLENLLLTGNQYEKKLAQAELSLIEARKNVKKDIREMVEDVASDIFEEALNKAGYKLVGHIEKI